ncbi:MAG TPA: I78 family peptidase inhibitor [Vicinamibacterales bacterium]|nr:I78 family peptidase inhibitor [Vicinamibacterales bacterium]
MTGSFSLACGGSLERPTAPAPPGEGGGAGQQPSGTRPPSPPVPPPPPDLSACDPTKVQWAIGQRASDELLKRARTDAGADMARFLRQGEPTTLEYRAGRLNLVTDEQGIVRSVTCG